MKAAVLLATLPLLAAATVSTLYPATAALSCNLANKQYEQPLEKRQSGCLAQCTGSVGCDALWGCVWEKCQVSTQQRPFVAIAGDCGM